MSLEELARKVGLTLQTIWRYEQDKLEPKASNLAALARALGVGSEELCPLPARNADGSKGEVPGAA